LNFLVLADLKTCRVQLVPAGTTGPGADLLVYSNIRDAAINSGSTNFLGICKNTRDASERIVMLRQGTDVSIYALLYAQPSGNVVYELLLNNASVATLIIVSPNTNDFLMD
jgi:hypothetical protein